MKIFTRHIQKITKRNRMTIWRWFTTGVLEGFKDGDGPTGSWYTTQEILESFIHRELTKKEIASIVKPQVIKRTHKCYNDNHDARGRFAKSQLSIKR